MRFRASGPDGRPQRPEELPAGVTWLEDLALPVGRLFSYNRISDDRQIKGTGIARQQDLAHEWCDQYGLSLDSELKLVDQARSAFKGKHLSKGCFGTFLKLAKERRLGLCPVLLLENLDRVSRLEPFDALQDVVFALIKAGVTLITLSPSSFEVYNKSRCDMMMIMRLVVELEKAHKYSANLSDRVARTWDKHDDELRKGVITRPKMYCPRWCRWDDDENVYRLIPEKVAVVERILDLLEDNGANGAAAILNAEGVRPFGRWGDGGDESKRWTGGTVRNVLMNDAIWGAATIHKPGSFESPISEDEYGRLHRTHWSPRSKGARSESEPVEGIYPPITTRERVERLRQIAEQRNTRRGQQSHVRSGEAMRWFGGRLTFCQCGALCSYLGGKGRNPRNERGRYAYLFCRSRRGYKAGDARRCNAPYMDMREVGAHVLARLDRSALAGFVASGGPQGDEGLQRQLELASLRVEELRSNLNRYDQNLQKVMEQTSDFTTIQALLNRKLELSRELEGEEEVMRELRRESALRISPPELEDAHTAIEELRQALLDDSSTVEQRRRVQQVLSDMGLTIWLDGCRRRVGLRVAEGPIDWQPLGSAAAFDAMAEGLDGAELQSDGEVEFGLKPVG